MGRRVRRRFASTCCAKSTSIEEVGAPLRLRPSCRRHFRRWCAPARRRPKPVDRSRPPRPPRASRRRVLGSADVFVHRCRAARRSSPTSAAIVPIGNPLSAQFAVLRPSLLPGLLDVCRAQPAPRADRCAPVRARRSRDARRRIAARRRGARPATATAHWSSGTARARFLRRERAGRSRRRRVADRTGIRRRPAPGASRARPCGLGVLRGTSRRAASACSRRRSSSAAGLPANEDVYVAELDLDALTACALRDAAQGRAAPALSLRSRATSRLSSMTPCPRKRFVALSVRLRQIRSCRSASSIAIRAKACPTDVSACRSASLSVLPSGP